MSEGGQKSRKSPASGVPSGPGAERCTSLAGRAQSEVARLASEPLAPALYLVSTPIGNLGDITLRALSVLARADVVYCEDTRHSRTLMTHFSLDTALKPYHEHNAEAVRPVILRELAAGRRVALISDAGTPLVSDPGFKLVRDCAAAGYPVVSIPGPSAALAALTASGLPTDSFFFAGFLPAKSAARRARLSELAAVPATLVVFEAPSRAAETLADMAALLAGREGAVARELTKLHEEVRRGSLAELARHFGAVSPKGEIVILAGPPMAGTVSDEDITARLSAALGAMSLRDAAQAVAEALGVPRARVYDLALALKRER